MIGSMRRYVTVSAKIPEEFKAKIDELGINVSQVIRRSLEEEVNRREEEKLKEMAREVSRILRKIPEDEIVRLIREDRESR